VFRTKTAALGVGALVLLFSGAFVGSSAANVAGGAIAPSGSVSTAVSGSLVTSQIARPNILVGQAITLSGNVAPQLIGTQTVELQIRTRNGWVGVAQDRALINGAYIVSYRPRAIGSYAVRAEVTNVATTAAAGGGAAAAGPSETVNVYHQVLASWYDLDGARTACGEVLTAHTLGVANKTLPCGTMVTFRYRSRILRVPVIDRGPYVAGRDYDLTLATKDALGAGDLTELWATR
jgi:hypothetical protein